MLQLFITISVIILLWLVLVYGGFYLLMAVRLVTARTAGVIVRVLYLLLFISAGVYYLFFSPVILRPAFGDRVFIIVSIVVAFLVVLFAVMALIAALSKRR